MNDRKAELKRQLSPAHVWALAFGCVVGWGSFINPGKKFLPNSGVAGTAIAMVMGAIVMIVIAFSYAYMVPKYPKAGGEFTFTKACFGKIPAYICGWFLVAAYLTNVPMNSTAIGLIVDGLDGSLDILKWGFDKAKAMVAFENGTYDSVQAFMHKGSKDIVSAILATFAIAPWAFVGFDTIPQAVQFTELSGRCSVSERPLSDAKRPLIFNQVTRIIWC